MIGAHSLIYGRPEPHLLTPLAHLGYFAKVDKAPYDAVLAAESVREFVADLPRGRAGLRRCLPRLLRHALSAHAGDQAGEAALPRQDARLRAGPRLHRSHLPEGEVRRADPPPARGLQLVCRVVLQRRLPRGAGVQPHPRALRAGDRQVPARSSKAPIYHVVYERLVADPETMLAEIFAFLGVPNEPQAVEYGKHGRREGPRRSIGVKKHTRPTTESIDKWAVEIAAPGAPAASAARSSRASTRSISRRGPSARRSVATVDRAGSSGGRRPRSSTAIARTHDDRQAARALVQRARCCGACSAPAARRRRAAARVAAFRAGLCAWLKKNQLVGVSAFIFFFKKKKKKKKKKKNFIALKKFEKQLDRMGDADIERHAPPDRRESAARSRDCRPRRTPRHWATMWPIFRSRRRCAMVRLGQVVDAGGAAAEIGLLSWTSCRPGNRRQHCRAAACARPARGRDGRRRGRSTRGGSGRVGGVNIEPGQHLGHVAQGPARRAARAPTADRRRAVRRTRSGPSRSPRP